MHCDKLKIIKVVDGKKVPRVDTVIRETEVVIKIDGRTYRRLTCLNEHLEELALGYLFDEGIASPSDVDVGIDGGVISVSRRRSSRARKPSVIGSDLQITDNRILDWADDLNKSCPLHIKTGGTHIVGMACGDDTFFVEDISRHCAIDKAIGMALRDGLDFSRCVLITSCRQTISAMKKAVMAGIPIVVTIAAPTTLAVTEAVDYGVTLGGFVRGGQFNIYSHPHRIVTGSR